MPTSNAASPPARLLAQTEVETTEGKTRNPSKLVLHQGCRCRASTRACWRRRSSARCCGCLRRRTSRWRTRASWWTSASCCPPSRAPCPPASASALPGALDSCPFLVTSLKRFKVFATHGPVHVVPSRVPTSHASLSPRGECVRKCFAWRAANRTAACRRRRFCQQPSEYQTPTFRIIFGTRRDLASVKKTCCHGPTGRRQRIQNFGRGWPSGWPTTCRTSSSCGPGPSGPMCCRRRPMTPRGAQQQFSLAGSPAWAMSEHRTRSLCTQVSCLWLCSSAKPSAAATGGTASHKWSA